MSDLEELNNKLEELNKKQLECQNITEQISTLRTQLNSIQKEQIELQEKNRNENKNKRSMKNQILYLENFKVDDLLYRPFYTEYCKNTNIIPLFSEPFTVNKYKKNRDILKKVGERHINIFYNLHTNMFQVSYYSNNNKVKKN